MLRNLTHTRWNWRLLFSWLVIVIVGTIAWTGALMAVAHFVANLLAKHALA
jgi:hypothetical protein